LLSPFSILPYHYLDWLVLAWLLLVKRFHEELFDTGFFCLFVYPLAFSTPYCNRQGFRNNQEDCTLPIEKNNTSTSAQLFPDGLCDLAFVRGRNGEGAYSAN